MQEQLATYSSLVVGVAGAAAALYAFVTTHAFATELFASSVALLAVHARVRVQAAAPAPASS